RHNSEMINDGFDYVQQDIASDDGVSVGQRVLVNCIYPLLHGVELAGFAKSDELDGSNTTITLNYFTTLDSLRKSLGENVVNVKEKSRVQFLCWDGGSSLNFGLLDTHGYMF
ncbi:hypothetical protein Q8G45_27985, partial [Klebsiella pneumoniae]